MVHSYQEYLNENNIWTQAMLDGNIGSNQYTRKHSSLHLKRIFFFFIRRQPQINLPYRGILKYMYVIPFISYHNPQINLLYRGILKYMYVIPFLSYHNPQINLRYRGILKYMYVNPFLSYHNRSRTWNAFR